MQFSLEFLEHDVSIAEDSWIALVTTGSDHSLASVRAVIEGVLVRGGALTVEGSDGQVVQRIDTPAAFEGFMQDVDMQRSQYEQDQA